MRARAQCQPPAPAQCNAPGARLAPRVPRLQLSVASAGQPCRSQRRAMRPVAALPRARAQPRTLPRAGVSQPLTLPRARARASQPQALPRAPPLARTTERLGRWRARPGTLPGSRAAAPCVHADGGMPVPRGRGRPPCRARALALLPSLARASPGRAVPVACRGSCPAAAALLPAPAVHCARWPRRRPPPRMPQSSCGHARSEAGASPCCLARSPPGPCGAPFALPAQLRRPAPQGRLPAAAA
jgi:hypothetical protein